MTKSVNQLVASKRFHHFVVAVMAGLRRKWAGGVSYTTSDRKPEEIVA